MTHIGPYELNSIVTGDSRELAAAIPDGSIDLIFTDPVYENVADYEWLGIEAMRVLKPNAAALIWTSTKKSRDCQAALEASGLTYQWVLNYVIPAKTGALHHYGVFLWTTQCFYFAKGRHKASPYITDAFISQTAPQTGFAWNKNIGVIEKWLNDCSKRDAIVFDPFTGTGSVPVACVKSNRNFIAFEMNSSRAQEARERVASTPLPLPFEPAMEQLALAPAPQ